jgi:hypothetical protein
MELLAAALGANALANADYCWPPSELRDFFLNDANAWHNATLANVADAVANCCLPDFPADCTPQAVRSYVLGLRPSASAADFYPLDERLRRALAEDTPSRSVQVFKALYHYALALLGPAAEEAVYFPKGGYSERFTPQDALQDVPYELGAPSELNKLAVEEEEEEEQEEQESNEEEQVAVADAEMDEVSRKRRQREVEKSPEAKRAAQEDQHPEGVAATPRRAALVVSEVMQERLQTQDFVNRLQVLLAEG